MPLLTRARRRRILQNLEKAVALDPKYKEMAMNDEDLEWARNDPRVRELLELS